MTAKTIRIKDDLHTKLKIAAIKKKRNLQNLCEEILENWVKEEEQNLS